MVRRQGKTDAYNFLMVVVLGVVVRGQVAIAQLGHIHARVTGVRLARSSFWARFTPEFAGLVRWLLDRIVNEARAPQSRPPGVLACFRDVIAADASVVKVHDSLRPIWKGTRRNSAKAALKVHAWIRVFTGELVKYSVTQEAYGDSKAFGIDHQLRGTLMLFDRGYASPSLWRRIDSVGGYFLTRIPAGWNPTVVEENRRHRGRARRLVGSRLREALAGLKRCTVDVGASFDCRVRGYAGEPSRKVKETFRVIAIRHPDTGEYALYATNAPPSMLRAEDVWRVYRLRWEVELFFKTSKSGCGMAELPSKNRHVVEALVFASLLRATIAMRSKQEARVWLRTRDDEWLNPLQWVRWWTAQLGTLLLQLVGNCGELDIADLRLLLIDPNKRRRPTRFSFGTT